MKKHTHEYSNKTITLTVYDKYIVAEAKDSVDIDKKEAEFVKEISEKHFDKEFGLIDYRINDVSLNVKIYEYGDNIITKNKIVAFALVSNSTFTTQNFSMEQVFLDKIGVQSNIFSSLDKAKEWMDKIFK